MKHLIADAAQARDLRDGGIGLIVSRLWCWLFGHRVHEITPSGRYPGEHTHFCPRCLLFWRQETKGQ